jgi:membrane-associated phospholipid phosphatase
MTFASRLTAVVLSVVLLTSSGAVSAAVQDPPPADPPKAAPPLIPGPGAVRVPPDDKRRTMKSYGSNLAYNFLGVLTRGNQKPLLITAAITAPSFLLDDEFKQYFADHPHENWADIGATIGGTVVVAGLTVGFFSAGRIARGDKFRATTYDLSQAIIVNGVYTQAIKFAVGRERPDKSNNQSFPSGHASNAFTAASVISRHYPKLAIPGYGLATYIAVSRMAANRHYFSDIVAGAGFGWSVGRVVVRRNGRPPDVKPGKTGEPPPDKSTWDIAPWAGPSGDGRGLALTIAF